MAFIFKNEEQFDDFVQKYGLESEVGSQNINIFVRRNKSFDKSCEQIDYYTVIIKLLRDNEEHKTTIANLKKQVGEYEDRLNKIWDETSARIDVFEKLIREKIDVGSS